MTARRNLVGRPAYGADGRHIGLITECDEESFTVEKGHLFPRDTFIPYEEIDLVEPHAVFLREDAAYYRSGGDVDDAHWDAEKARRSRAIQGEGRQAHEVGLKPPEAPAGKGSGRPPS